MSTRSNIALVKKGGAVEAIYCHHDGYPEGIGETLAKCYGEEEEVAAMLELGDMSLLRDTLETCVFYHRDFGGENTAENTRRRATPPSPSASRRRTATSSSSGCTCSRTTAGGFGRGMAMASTGWPTC